MAKQEEIRSRILNEVRSESYRPQKPRSLAKDIHLHGDQEYPAFREALKELMRQGRVIMGSGGAVVLPSQQQSRNTIVGVYRQHRRGFGFVIPSDPQGHADLFIPEGQQGGAITGDTVRATITSRGHKDGKAMFTGQVVDIVERTRARFVGTLARRGDEWLLQPDGNAYTDIILVPDAASRGGKAGLKVVVEITTYATESAPARGVITQVIGREGDKDVDLRSIIAQHHLREEFPDAAMVEARRAIDACNMSAEAQRRLDLSRETVITIDPDNSRDFDDAISLKQVEGGYWELGVHIADVSHFVREGSALDEEAAARGNSVYFPGYVIPMLPEILSNGICSLQEGVPRLCKSAFITLDEDAKPIRTRVANTLIRSTRRLRYREAQAIIDRAPSIPHPEGNRTVADYPTAVVQLLHHMNALARRIQKRRHAAGQLVLNLPRVELVLDDEGRVVGAEPEDHSYTHTVIEMFMVEANEAVARLFGSYGVPFLRRIHPDPGSDDAAQLREFITVSGFKFPKTLDRHSLQALLAAVRGKPAEFAINLAVLKSLSRAEYSPQVVGHYALASEDYCHFTSPIRRYADLTIHRLLDIYLAQAGQQGGRRKAVHFDQAPDEGQLIELGKRLSFTERRAEDAERELRQVKILTLLQQHVGDVLGGVVTGITNFGLFIQLETWLVDGLARYEQLMDDWWDVNASAGFIRGQRTGTRIALGDLLKVRIARVDLPRRELDLAVLEVPRKSAGPQPPQGQHKARGDQQRNVSRGGSPRGGGPRGGGPRGGGPRRGPHPGAKKTGRKGGRR